jgi:hypothetical protein
MYQIKTMHLLSLIPAKGHSYYNMLTSQRVSTIGMYLTSAGVLVALS